MALMVVTEGLSVVEVDGVRISMNVRDGNRIQLRIENPRGGEIKVTDQKKDRIFPAQTVDKVAGAI